MALKVDLNPALFIQSITIVFFSIAFCQMKLRNFFFFYSFAFYALLQVYIFQSLAIATALLTTRYLTLFIHLPTFFTLLSRRLYILIILGVTSIFALPQLLTGIVSILGINLVLLTFLKDYSEMYNVANIDFSPVLFVKLSIIYIFGLSGWIPAYALTLVSATFFNEIFSRFLSIIFFIAISRGSYDINFRYIAFVIFGFTTGVIELYRDLDAA